MVLPPLVFKSFLVLVEKHVARFVEAEGFGVCFGTEDQKAGMKAFLNKTKYEYLGK